MAIADDISVSVAKDIRWTGGATTYTVLELHRFLQDIADNASVLNDDLVDITSATPSDRSTDNIITLINGFNIDDLVAEHLYDGSITQAGGDTVYSGLEIVGAVVAGTELQIIQDDRILKNFYGTGLNANAAANVISRILVKTRDLGVDIDGKRLRIRAGEYGTTFAEFSVTAGLGNATAAVFTQSDLNNQTAAATVAGYTTIVQASTGFTLLDVTGDAIDEEYLDQWDLGSQTINDLYERAKFIQQRAATEAFGTDVGSNFPVGDGTFTGQGQSFAVGVNAKHITRVRAQLKKVGAPTGSLVAKLYTHANTFGTSSTPTGAALATSDPLDVSKLTTAYQTLELTFNGLDNLDQQVLMSASTNYVVTFEYAGGGVSDYVDVRGLAASGTAPGNRSDNNGSWGATSNDDLWFEVDASMSIHGRAGESYRGITHQIPYDTEAAGPFLEDEVIAWGTSFAFDTGVGTFAVGEYATFGLSGAVGKLVAYSGAGATGTMVFAIEPGSGTVVDNDTITGLTSGATALVAGAVADPTAVGGSGLLLALDDQGATGTLYIQLLNGAAPVNNLPIEGRTSAATCLVNGSVTSRTLSPSFIGQSTGSAIIGAYGVGIQPADLTASDLLFDLSNTPRVPPNNVTFTVSGLVIGEDRVLVGPESGGNIQFNQRTLLTTLSGAAETAVVLTSAIPSDTPAVGTIRIQLDDGTYRRQPYTSWSGSTFAIAASDYSVVNATNPRNVFVAYIDKLATAVSETFTVVFNSTRSLFVRVRDGDVTPIKTFETTGSLGSAGGSSTVIRTPDA